MQLSQSQEAAKKDFLDFLDDPQAREFTISGPAGSGKTFLLTYLLEAAYNEQALLSSIDDAESKLAIYLSATTHKAVEVLKQAVPEYTAETVYSRLNLRVNNDYKTGTTSLVRTTFRNKNEFMDSLKFGCKTILVIDEASMVNRELYDYIKKLIERTKDLRIVYVGDKYQLPPVMESCSPVFTRVKNISYLTEIQRQSDSSTIIPVAQEMRDVMDTAGLWPAIVDSTNIKVFREPQEWLQAIGDAFTQNPDPTSNRVLAWSNKHVAGYNNHVLSALGHTTMFYEGNTAINNTRCQPNPKVAFQADEPLRIMQVHCEYEHKITLSCNVSRNTWQFAFAGIKLQVRSLRTNSTAEIQVPLNFQQFNAVLKQIADVIKKNDLSWKTYFDLKEQVCDLRPSFAQTLHKSQGSTYGNVFIDLQDVSRNNKWLEVAQLVYTGMTRASNNVYFYGELAEKWTKNRKESINEVFTHETASFT